VDNYGYLTKGRGRPAEKALLFRRFILCHQFQWRTWAERWFSELVEPMYRRVNLQVVEPKEGQSESFSGTWNEDPNLCVDRYPESIMEKLSRCGKP